MSSKHKIIQWNRTSKRIGKEVPRLLLEMSTLSLTPMTATTVYENDVRDFREKNEALLSSLWVISNYLFTGLVSLAESIKLLMRYHWFKSSRFFFRKLSRLCDVIRLEDIVISSPCVVKFFFYLARKSCKFLYICIWMRCSCDNRKLACPYSSSTCTLRVCLCIFFYGCSIVFCISSCFFFDRRSLLCLVSSRIKFI